MLFGLRNEFSYTECGACGCLQIDEVPENLNTYYPDTYYTFAYVSRNGCIRHEASIKRDKYLLFGTGLFGNLLAKKFPDDHFEMLARSGIRRSYRILDVGCGAGFLLYRLRDLGFENLTGVDPFIAGDITDGGLRLLKKSILDLPAEKYDFIMFNHSLEHIPDQLETLSAAADLLSKGGTCLVRIPVKVDHIWDLYGVNWVQIDAPRHFFLHTLQSFSVLADKAGFEILSTYFDSTEFQFWGSEQYKRDVPLLDDSGNVTPRKDLFTSRQIREFRQTSKRLNQAGKGDQAGFILIKKYG